MPAQVSPVAVVNTSRAKISIVVTYTILNSILLIAIYFKQ